MKRFIVIVLCLLTGNSFFSQDYIPFPDSVATWNVNQSGYIFEDEINGNRGYNFHIEGDTIVNDTTYSKLYTRLAYFTNNGSGVNSLTNDPYFLVGGIREDSTKKVWFRNMNFEDWETDAWPLYVMSMNSFGWDDTTPLVEQINAFPEVLLYDFGMEIGDSIYFQGDIEIFEPYWAYVEEITIDILGRKTMKFSYSGDCWDDPCGRIWVEGIGDIRSHPFSIYDTNEIIGLGFQYGNDLRCFWENGVQIYEHESLDYVNNCENVFVGIAEIERKTLQVYPNPSKDIFNISLPNYEKSTIRVFNALGEEIINRKVIGDSHQIDLSEFPNGVYMILLETEDVIYSAKILKE